VVAVGRNLLLLQEWVVLAVAVLAVLPRRALQVQLIQVVVVVVAVAEDIVQIKTAAQAVPA